MNKNNSQNRLKAYLDQRAQEDPLFAVSYAKEHKNLDDCYEYIKGQAQKQAIKGCAFVEDDVVFSWDVHYYDEDDIKVEKTTSSRISVSAPTPKKVEVPKAKLKSKKEDVGQLSLF